jgi:hypothetical protein
MKLKLFAALVAATLLSVGVVEAKGGGTYTLAVGGPSSTSVGSTFDAPVLLTFDGAAPISGWSYGVCNDTAFITCDGSSDGSTTTTVNNGGPADFIQGTDFPEGYTKGIVVSLLGAATLAPGAGYEVSVGHYSATAETAGSDLALCDSLGTPPVAVVVVVNGSSIAPNQQAQSVEVLGVPDPIFTYQAPSLPMQGYPVGDGIGGLTFSADFSIAEADQSPALAFPSDTQGFSMALANDASLITPTGVNATGPLSSLNGGAGPDFFQVGLYADAWSVGVVNNLLGGVFVQYSAGGDAVVTVGYEGVAGALLGVEGMTSSPLTWSSAVGTPPVSLVVVVDGSSYPAATSDGSVTFNGSVAIPFERGDSNRDGIINIADIISNLNQQFHGTPILCSIANDANDDDLVDLADPVYVATWIFLEGAEPPYPFGACDTDPGQTPEDCLESGCAP